MIKLLKVSVIYLYFNIIHSFLEAGYSRFNLNNSRS
jgi:hypothetical protein